MNEIHYDVIIDQYKIILKSVIIFYFFIQQKFAKIFLELFSKYVDDQNYCNQVFSCNKEKNKLFSFSKKVTYNSWYEIYLQSCKKQRGQDLPNLAFNYCFEKAKCLYIKMKKLSKEKNIKFMNIARTVSRYKHILNF